MDETTNLAGPARARTPSLKDVPRGPLLAGAIALAAVGWSYAPALAIMARRWLNDPRYAHGWLVGAFAVYLLWVRRDRLAGAALRPSAWGLLLVLSGALARLAGAYIAFDWLVGASLVPILVGLALVIGGTAVGRWAALPAAFLVFAVPLPYQLEVALGQPLLRNATKLSTFTLETIGLPAVAEGNIINIGDARIGVVDACNGLGMLVSFAWIACAVACLTRKGPLVKGVVVLAAAPIAIAANVARIVITGFLYATVGGGTADTFYHDAAGWVMMPLALAALWLLLWILDRLVIEVTPPDDALAEHWNAPRPDHSGDARGTFFPEGGVP